MLFMDDIWIAGIVLIIAGVYNAAQVGSIGAYERMEKRERDLHGR